MRADEQVVYCLVVAWAPWALVHSSDMLALVPYWEPSVHDLASQHFLGVIKTSSYSPNGVPVNHVEFIIPPFEPFVAVRPHRWRTCRLLDCFLVSGGYPFVSYLEECFGSRVW